jgi:hypothetical protein
MKKQWQIISKGEASEVNRLQTSTLGNEGFSKRIRTTDKFIYETAEKLRRQMQ